MRLCIEAAQASSASKLGGFLSRLQDSLVAQKVDSRIQEEIRAELLEQPAQSARVEPSSRRLEEEAPKQQQSPQSNDETASKDKKRKNSAQSFSEEKIIKKYLQKEKLQLRIKQLDEEIRRLQSSSIGEAEQRDQKSIGYGLEDKHRQRFVISDDRDAQDKALELVRKMNLQRRQQTIRVGLLRKKR